MVATTWERLALWSSNGLAEVPSCPPGTDRHLRVDPVGGTYVTPVYVFGGRRDERLPQPTMVTRQGEGDSVRVVFRVDLRPVLPALGKRAAMTRQRALPSPPRTSRASGSWATPGRRRGIWRTWTATSNSASPTRNDDGVSRTPIAFEKRDVRPLNDEARTVWSLSEDVSDSPSCRSDQRLGVAIFPQRGVDAGSDWGYSNVLRV